jgi:hypothetical protein|tara:strand:- start:1915 stop:2532 length:618 start_codon:yes stop_codon:yes gene_type:complete
MNDIIQIENLESIDLVRKAITDKHKSVSNIKTPKPFIKKKMGMEYVEYSYMREIADKEFPGWSWKVVNTEVLGSEAYVVHGRLKFYDEGIWRECDVTASHRIQKQRGTNDFVDIGNDVKAANTDAIKKAFNMYMNIADDVYRNQVDDLELSDLEKSDILVLASEISEEKLEQIKELIEDDTINTANYKASFAKLEREVKEQKESK